MKESDRIRQIFEECAEEDLKWKEIETNFQTEVDVLTKLNV